MVTRIIGAEEDSPVAMAVNPDGSINVSPASGGSGLATAANQTAVQGTYGVTTVNNVAVIDPSTGNPITYSSPTNVQGPDASGAAITGQPLLSGGRAATAAPTAVTNGQAVAMQMTQTGRPVIAPYARHDQMVRGTVTATGTGASTILAAGAANIKTYVTGVQIGRTDSATGALTVTFNDSASTVVIVPGSGGATNIVFTTPLVTAAATAFTGTSGTGVTTLYLSAQGYYDA